MINHLMTSVTHPRNFSHECVKIILYNEGGEESLTSYVGAIGGKRLGNWYR
jgi:hypothetical protein